MTNDIDIIYGQQILASEFAKYARIKTYGLHYKTDMIGLLARHMVVRALLINEDLGVLSDAEVTCLKFKLQNANITTTAINTGCGCSS